jgi:hypothetical protein
MRRVQMPAVEIEDGDVPARLLLRADEFLGPDRLAEDGCEVVPITAVEHLSTRPGGDED